MTNGKDQGSKERTTRESEIFRGPPGSGNYSSSIGAAQGIELFSGAGQVHRARSAKTIAEPARQVPVFAEVDVLVIGGGTAGSAAAIAAARLGADVLLVERYNHLGGVATGGLVIWIDRMTDWSGQHIIRGVASEFMDRLPNEAIQGPPRADWGNRDAATAAYWAQRTAAYHGIVTWSPTIDPGALKTLSMRMVDEAKVRLLLHAWCTTPIVEDGVIRGAIFESKEGRHAILAKVIVDTTGDADLVARGRAV
jgi:flavin-dependent dehydrogenase